MLNMDTVLAQKLVIPGGQVSGPPGFTFTDIGAVVTSAIPFVIAFAGFGLLLMLIRAGYSFLTSAGDAKKLETGKQQLTYALVGFIVIFVAYWLVIILGRIFGVVEIQNTFQ